MITKKDKERLQYIKGRLEEISNHPLLKEKRCLLTEKVRIRRKCICNELNKVLISNFSGYECADCGKGYFSPGDAEVVWRWYDCPECGRSMGTKDWRQTNIYKCNQCQLEFKIEELRKIQEEKKKC